MLPATSNADDPRDGAPFALCLAVVLAICVFLGGCAGWILHGVFA